METENPEPKNPFLEIGRKDYDSLGTLEWRNYLEAQKLYDAWATPQGSPYKVFERRGTIDSVDQFVSFMWPRYSGGKIKSVDELSNLIQSGVLGRETAVILDSGGAHSVAMAAKLARDLGYQPIVMLDAVVHPNGIVKAEQDLFVLLYFAHEIKKLKLEGVIRADSPPVFVLDLHRQDVPRQNFDNS